MEFKQLETFIAVSDLNSFSKAAKKLYITQPAVSTQIAALERELGFQLFVRSSKDISPTREGRVFYQYAKDILDKRDQTLVSLQNLGSAHSSILTIAASTIPARHYLPPLLADFHRQHRNVFFRMFCRHDSIQIVQNVADGKAELGFIGVYVSSAQCDVQHLAYDHWVLVTPNTRHFQEWLSDRSFSPDQILRERFICREQGSGVRKDVDHFLEQLGIAPSELRFSMEVDDTESILELVARGLGVSVVSQRSAETFRQSGRVLTKSFDSVVSSKDIYLVKSRAIPLSVTARKLYDFAAAYYRGSDPTRRV